MTREDLIDEIWSVMQNVQDYDTGLHDFAKAVVRDVPLIAAAPDLLAALQKATEEAEYMAEQLEAEGYKDYQHAVARVIAECRAALARALPSPAAKEVERD
jgi:hypothetical protein